MKNLTLIFLLATAGLISACSNTSTENSIIQSVNVEEFDKLINEQKGVLLDVRTPGENAAGNIPNSKLMNVNDSNFAANVATLDKNTPVLVYCRSGARSMKAANYLEKQGFKSIYNLSGGYIAWSKKKN